LVAKSNKSKNNYVVCWFEHGHDATIVGVMIERKSRSDTDWIDEKSKVEKSLQRGLDSS